MVYTSDFWDAEFAEKIRQGVSTPLKNSLTSRPKKFIFNHWKALKFAIQQVLICPFILFHSCPKNIMLTNTSKYFNALKKYRRLSYESKIALS